MSAIFRDLYEDALAWGNSSNTDAAKRYVNDAQRILLHSDPAFAVTVTACPVTATAATYQLGSGIFLAVPATARLREVMYQSPGELAIPLVLSTIERILALQPADAAGPTREYAYEGTGRLYFWPNLSRNDTVTIHHASVLTPLVNDSDVPTVPEDFLALLSDYAAWQLAKGDDHGIAEYHHANWDRGRVEYRKYLRQRRGTNTIVIRPGYPGDYRQRQPHDNSVYPAYRPQP